MSNRIIQEQSVGAVIFHKSSSYQEYLITHYPKGARSGMKGHWDLIKGHIDEGESDLETLMREAEEETGLTQEHLKLINGFCEKIAYNFRTEQGLHFKQVTFYLLESDTKQITLSKEHDEYRWLSKDEVIQTITFQGGKEMVEKANIFLRNIK